MSLENIDFLKYLLVAVVENLTDTLNLTILVTDKLLNLEVRVVDQSVMVIISDFRLIASDNGVAIAASYWGKFKTTFQMVMICLMIANFPQLQILTDIIMWIALILTVVSLIDYLVKNKDVMKDTK